MAQASRTDSKDLGNYFGFKMNHAQIELRRLHTLASFARNTQFMVFKGLSEAALYRELKVVKG